jgi:hypothetical protein
MEKLEYLKKRYYKILCFIEKLIFRFSDFFDALGRWYHDIVNRGL